MAAVNANIRTQHIINPSILQTTINIGRNDSICWTLDVLVCSHRIVLNIRKKRKTDEFLIVTLDFSDMRFLQLYGTCQIKVTRTREMFCERTKYSHWRRNVRMYEIYLQ